VNIPPLKGIVMLLNTMMKVSNQEGYRTGPVTWQTKMVGAELAPSAYLAILPPYVERGIRCIENTRILGNSNGIASFRRLNDVFGSERPIVKTGKSSFVPVQYSLPRTRSNGGTRRQTFKAAVIAA